jgi:hypothetical protein
MDPLPSTIVIDFIVELRRCASILITRALGYLHDYVAKKPIMSMQEKTACGIGKDRTRVQSHEPPGILLLGHTAQPDSQAQIKKILTPYALDRSTTVKSG